MLSESARRLAGATRAVGGAEWVSGGGVTLSQRGCKGGRSKPGTAGALGVQQKRRLSGNSKRKRVMKKHFPLASRRMIHPKLINQSARLRSARPVARERSPLSYVTAPFATLKTQRGPFIPSSNMFYWQYETFVSRGHKSTLDLTLRASGYFSPVTSALNKQEKSSSRRQAAEGRTVYIAVEAGRTKSLQRHICN